MSDFVVYGVPGSPFMRSVLVALEEKRAPYRVEALAPGALRTPEYRRLHPFGRVPAIRHGDFHLYETQAILRYVDATFAGPALQPREPEAIGRMNQVIGINDWYLFPRVARVIVFERIVGPALFGKTPDEAAIAAALPEARLCLGELDRLLGDQQAPRGRRVLARRRAARAADRLSRRDARRRVDPRGHRTARLARARRRAREHASDAAARAAAQGGLNVRSQRRGDPTMADSSARMSPKRTITAGAGAPLDRGERAAGEGVRGVCAKDERVVAEEPSRRQVRRSSRRSSSRR